VDYASNHILYIKKGCPNFNKRRSCPPFAPIFDIYFCMDEVWAIWNVFDFGAHVDRMRLLHPDWSERQLVCCLYWQSKARKSLELEIDSFKISHPNLHVTRVPEAMGVNVTETMRLIGVELEWPPNNFALQIALAARLNP
jgi:predicted metal-binding protein